MSQIWKDEKVIPVTLIEAGPCTVTQVKTKENDGYEAVQIGFDKIEKKVSQQKAPKPFKNFSEFRVEGSELKPGDVIDLTTFEEGEKARVTGISKGKGYQGAVKRWNFAGQGTSHGVKDTHRRVGSIGCRWPQRVIPGKKMPGHMGYEQNTIKGIEIVKIDKENNIIAVKGAVPGGTGRLLEIIVK